MAVAAPGDFVRVEYHGREKKLKSGDIVRDETNPLILMWDSRPYRIDVGQSGFAPFEAMANALGDPRSGENMATARDAAGNTFFILDRATEVRRLRCLYDNQVGDNDEIMFAPDCSVYDLEGEAIKTVMDDPTGQSVLPATQTLLDRDQLLAQVQRQQRMIETLASAQGIDLADPNLIAQEPERDDNGDIITKAPDQPPDTNAVPEDV